MSMLLEGAEKMLPTSSMMIAMGLKVRRDKIPIRVSGFVDNLVKCGMLEVNAKAECPGRLDF